MSDESTRKSVEWFRNAEPLLAEAMKEDFEFFMKSRAPVRHAPYGPLVRLPKEPVD